MKNKEPEYIQVYSNVEGNLHGGFIKNNVYELYIYRDTVHITENGKIICRAKSGRMVVGGIDIFAIRGPSDELFVCAWVYNFSTKKMVDFMAAISVPDIYDENIIKEHRTILKELINECKKEIYEG